MPNSITAGRGAAVFTGVDAVNWSWLATPTEKRDVDEDWIDCKGLSWCNITGGGVVGAGVGICGIDIGVFTDGFDMRSSRSNSLMILVFWPLDCNCCAVVADDAGETSGAEVEPCIGVGMLGVITPRRTTGVCVCCFVDHPISEVCFGFGAGVAAARFLLFTDDVEPIEDPPPAPAVAENIGAGVFGAVEFSAESLAEAAFIGFGMGVVTDDSGAADALALIMAPGFTVSAGIGVATGAVGACAENVCLKIGAGVAVAVIIGLG